MHKLQFVLEVLSAEGKHERQPPVATLQHFPKAARTVGRSPHAIDHVILDGGAGEDMRTQNVHVAPTEIASAGLDCEVSLPFVESVGQCMRMQGVVFSRWPF